MNQTKYLTIKEVVQLHEMLIDRFGGSHGIRDLGLLASALERPKTGYYATLCEQSAALCHSLVLNHSFLDGNKRIGALCLMVFLSINGQKLKTTDDELVEFIIDEIIQNKKSISDLAAWIEKRI